MARTVTYQRGSDSVEIPATPAEEPFVVGNRSWQGRYFKLRVAGLVLAGSVTLPAFGDKVTETVNGVSITYDVMAPPGDPLAWRYIDDRLGLIVHACDTGDWESVTYYPGGHLYDPRSVRAVLERNPPDVIPAANGAGFFSLSWRITMPRASIGGVPPQDGMDLVDLPPNIGDAAAVLSRRFKIDRVLGEDDPAFWTIGVLR